MQEPQNFKIENIFLKKDVFDLKKYRISYLISFRYRDEEIIPKTRTELSEVYKIVE